MVARTIQNAINAISAQSALINEHVFSAAPEEADAAERQAHQALEELRSLKARVDSGEQLNEDLEAAA